MKTLAEVRSQYPGYDSKSDAELASALHKKFYSEIPEKDFYAQIGLSEVVVPPAKAPPATAMQEIGMGALRAGRA